MKIEVNFDEVIEDVVLDVLEDIDEMQLASADILLDMLTEEGATHSELAFATYILDRYQDIFNDVINDVFEIEEVECDEDDCEGCPFALE